MQFERWIPIDIQKGQPGEIDIGPVLFEGDNCGMRLGIRLFDDGEPVTVTGTVSAWAIVSTGQTISPIEEVGKDGNAAWVDVPQDTLIPGRAEFFLRVTDGDNYTVALDVYATVKRTQTGETVVPGDPLPNVDQMRQLLAECESAGAAAIHAVRYDTEQNLSEAEKEQARTNIGAVDEKALAAVFAPVEYWGDDATVVLSGRRVKRENGYEYTVTGTSEGGVATGNVYHKLSGPLGVISTSSGMNNWTSSVELESGVPYTMTVIPLSGSIGGSGDFYLLMRDENNVNRAVIHLDGTMQTARFYWPDSALKGKLILRTTMAVVTNDFRFRLILARDTNAIPQAPATDGTYTLRLTVTDGVPAYAWVSESAGLMSTAPEAPDPTDESEE